MRRLLSLMAFVFCGFAANAQEPRVTIELSEPETLVGQPLNLVVEILVPTWMPTPPVYPTFEVPSLMVRLPERSTTSISEQIDGATWAGVRRNYRLYPLVPGPFRIPPQALTLTYADPESREPIMLEVPSPEVSFSAVVPEAARALDPLIVASGFTLEQNIEGENTLAPGDAVVRTVRATINGTTVVMVPALVSATETPGLRSYPAEPTITEAEERGLLSGTREEKVTYLAQANGAATLPEIRFDWFNIETGNVESASVPAFEVTVEGVVGAAEQRATRETLLRVGAILVLLVAIALSARRFQPLVLTRIRALQDRWHGSERYACRQLQRAIRDRDLNEIYRTRELWKTRGALSDGALRPLAVALTEVGAAAYGNSERDADGVAAWRDVETAFQTVRREKKRFGRTAGAGRLPPLNPF